MFRAQLGEDLSLRLMEDRYAVELWHLVDANRAYLREWLPWLDDTTNVDDIRSFIRQGLDQFARGAGFHAGVWYQGKLAGLIGYHPIDWSHRHTSLGYWLSADLQGRGIITRACRAMLDHAFNDLGLHRMTIHCATGNHRSQAVPARLGFTREGVLVEAQWLYDRYVDLVIYRMLAHEWRALSTSPR